MGGRDMTNVELGNTDALDPGQVAAAGRVLLKAARRCGGSRLELLWVLAAIDHPGAWEALKRAESDPEPPAIPAQREDPAGSRGGDSAAKTDASVAAPATGGWPMCAKGLHEMTPDNTYHRPNSTKRECRECIGIARRAWRKDKQAATLPKRRKPPTSAPQVCPKGRHPMDEANTYRRKNSNRIQCRACLRDVDAVRRERKREARVKA